MKPEIHVFYSVVRVPPVVVLVEASLHCVHVNSLVTTIALIENCRSFIGTSQLLLVVPDLLPAALLACMLDDARGLNFVVVDGLHFGSLRAQSRGKRGGLRSRDDRLGGGVCHITVRLCRRKYPDSLRTFARCTADGAGQNHISLAGAAVEQVAAVCAEDERADCGHCGALLLFSRCETRVREKSTGSRETFAGSTSMFRPPGTCRRARSASACDATTRQDDDDDTAPSPHSREPASRPGALSTSASISRDAPAPAAIASP